MTNAACRRAGDSPHLERQRFDQRLRHCRRTRGSCRRRRSAEIRSRRALACCGRGQRAGPARRDAGAAGCRDCPAAARRAGRRAATLRDPAGGMWPDPPAATRGPAAARRDPPAAVPGQPVTAEDLVARRHTRIPQHHDCDAPVGGRQRIARHQWIAIGMPSHCSTNAIIGQPPLSVSRRRVALARSLDSSQLDFPKPA